MMLSRIYSNWEDLTREELHEKVWDAPVSEIAEDYQISDRGLGKLCKRHKIPTPGRGYWAKKEHGHDVEREPLPDVEDPRLETIRLRPKSEDEDKLPPDIQRKIERENDEDWKIEVSDDLRGRADIVARTRDSFDTNSLNDRGLAGARGDDVLSVVVAPESIHRAMRVMDAIIKALRRRGGGVTVERNKHKGRQSLAVLNDEKMAFSLMERAREMTDQERKARKAELSNPFGYFRQKFVPTGKFTLSIDGGGTRVRGNFNDAKIQKVEDVLNEFMISLWKLSVSRKRGRKRRKIREKKREKKRKRKQKERRRRNQLKEDVDDWHRAERIREYIEAVKADAQERGRSLEPGSDLAEWIEWAEKRAAASDPLEQDGLPDDLETYGKSTYPGF